LLGEAQRGSPQGQHDMALTKNVNNSLYTTFTKNRRPETDYNPSK
jgi:hypothetical protein